MNINESEIKYLDNLFIPRKFKIKIIDKIGIENLFEHYEEIGSEFKKISNDSLLYTIYKYHREEFINFFSNLNTTKSPNFYILNTILKDSNRLCTKILKYINVYTIEKLISTTECDREVINKLYEIRKEEIYTIINNAINYNNYQAYINYNTPNKIREYIINKIDIKTLINDIKEGRNSIVVAAVIDYREKDVIEYIKSISNNQIEIKELLKINFSNTIHKELLDKIIINDDTLSYIYTQCDNKLKNLTYTLYETKINNWLNSLINNNSYLDIIKYSPDTVVTYTIGKLNDKQLEELIKDKRVLYYSNINNVLYTLRRKDIIDIISQNISEDNLKIVDYLSAYIPTDVLNEVFNNIEVNEVFINKILEKGTESSIECIFKLYKEEILNIIIEESKKDRKAFIDKYIITFKYPLVLKKELLKEMKDDEIVYILEQKYLSLTAKDYLFELDKDKVINIYNNLLEKNLKKAQEIFNTSNDTKLREYLINNLNFDYLYLLINDLSEKEEQIIYKKHSIQLINKLREEYKKDLLSFINKRIINSYGMIENMSLSILNNDDLIFALCNNALPNYFAKLHPELFKLIDNAIKNKANNIKNLSYDQCLIFLKSIREISDDLFITFLKNIDLDDNFLHKLFIERGLSDSQKEKLFNIKKNDIIRIVKDKIANKEIDPVEYIQKGTPKEILSYVLSKVDKKRILELLNDQVFIKRKSIGEKFATKLALTTYNNENNVVEVEELLKCYLGNKFELAKNYEKIQDFLICNNINVSKFWQYSLNTSYNFISDIINIYENDLDMFLQTKNILFNHIYKENNKYSYKEFLDFIKNYTRYKELCISLIKLDNLSTLDFKNIKLLFKQNTKIPEINNYKDCDNILNIIKKEYQTKFNNCTTIKEYKDVLFKLLFNCDTDTIELKLSNYGGVCNLIELNYYNLHNKEVTKRIDKVKSYTQLMELIISINNIDDLHRIFNHYIESNFDFADYDELMRELYAVEMDYNLSKVGNNIEIDKVKKEEKSNTYGVDVYDFSDKQYALLAHVISNIENIDDLIIGKSSGKYNFISFSAISHRMQAYYYNARNTIFGYDEMPYHNFICSSNQNMGSNHSIKNNSTEVNITKRTQRGLLEVSDTQNNSEILSLREGMRPKYIICPGRDPYPEEIECAKKYNLKIAITQRTDHSIDSPKKITNVIEEKQITSKDYLVDFNNIPIAITNKNKIAIITDAHGIFESTLTVLEDLNKKGITQIYSLGDNIGTGCNPSQVINLLNYYGVKSIKGNHELYLTEGVEKYKEHLDKTDSFEKEKENTNWILNNLTKDQIDSILNYEDYIELNINEKKILLCHYLYDYNTNKLLYDPSKYDLIIQGHKHFAKQEGNIITLKAIGIGNNTKEDTGKATYMIIDTQNKELSYKYINIPYSYKNSINAENISDNNCSKKLIKWISSSSN